ncbi:MAG: GGDEF domain-containing protein [Congregibacter sp.]
MIIGVRKRLSALGRADFITRSAFGISLAAFLIMSSFGINNFVQGRFAGGVTALLLALLFFANTVTTSRGTYPLYLNLFGIVPALALASITALISLQVVGSYWPYLCVFSIYFILPFHYAKYASLAYLVLVLAVASVYLERVIAIRFCTVLIATSVFIFIFSREIEKSQDGLKKLATTDTLTGVLNRTMLTESLTQATEQFHRRGNLSTVCLIDIDNFKAINDNFGHDAGDKVLATFAKEISKQLAVDDVLFRIGGEEFLILLKNTGVNEGQKTAEVIRSIVQELSLLEGHEVTVSIGVSEVDAGFDWKAWMKSCDEKLYLAKKRGRNQVVS